VVRGLLAAWLVNILQEIDQHHTIATVTAHRKNANFYKSAFGTLMLNTINVACKKLRQNIFRTEDPIPSLFFHKLNKDTAFFVSSFSLREALHVYFTLQ
jgi:hypothetical protein